jgi:GNAT superfamily N-acetyltransferase
MSEFNIRPLERSDREWVAHFLDERWGTTQVVSRGKPVYGHLLPGFTAERVASEEGEDSEESADKDSKPDYVGLITVNAQEKECEITTLDSLEPEQGVGTALVQAVEAWAKESGIKRLWLVTTNDNLGALKFWQKRGYKLVMIHRGAIAEARRIKPQISITGLDGIPILDEIELEKLL